MAEAITRWGKVQEELLNYVDKLMASKTITRNFADKLQREIINARSVEDLSPELQNIVAKQEF